MSHANEHPECPVAEWSGVDKRSADEARTHYTPSAAGEIVDSVRRLRV
jgi:hypothetical protein